MTDSIVINRIQLLKNGSPLPIRDFTLQSPSNALGLKLSATFAKPDVVVTTDDAISLRIGVVKDGNTSWIDYITDGKVAGQTALVEFRNDTLTIEAINLLADRWRLCSRQPIVCYDPNLISFEEVDPVRTQNDLVDEDSVPIEFILEAIEGLTLRQVLHRAYVVGCGFQKVVTNLPDYPIRRIDFAISAGYHAAVLPFVSFFDPVFYADDNNVLFIIDIDGTLPSELVSKKLRLKSYKSVSFERPLSNISNAILLTFKEDAADGGDDWPDNATEKIISTWDQTGEVFQPGWTRQEVDTYYKEFHSDPAKPDRVTRRVQFRLITRNYAFDEARGIPVLISTETEDDKWIQNFRLKSGYTKTIESRLSVPYGGPRRLLVNAWTEINSIVWTPSLTSPDEFQKQSERTEIEGLILYEGQFTDTLQEGSTVTSAVALIQANDNRLVTQDGFQQIKRGPIKTEFEFWRDTGTDQIDVLHTVIDHLIPQVKTSKTVQSISDRTVNINKQRTVTMLIRDEEAETAFGLMEPLALNAGEVPFDIAYKVALRQLERLGARPRSAKVELPRFDAAIRKGSLRDIDDREGDSHKYLITGWTITGRELGGANGSISMSTDGVATREDITSE